MQKDPETKVDRSRLTLLLGLSSTAAAAGCMGTPTAQKKGDDAYDTLKTFRPRDVDTAGGEGGEGGGGGSH
ncbi:hypothetical protein IMCC20628_00582 [Hoeflea sp. IMCC20628]|uniref:hypothetical protein n=1 Tax=Hoeflea sp. IMCC20628 TaxID=1620421 RepID=UPI00063B0058|nr:hypothetical protein [Hoeflea sp. IMCC20628]AKH99306.1 hypothetical protein IMCC20628_00582 [Hoeflea sp. IMCC20628]